MNICLLDLTLFLIFSFFPRTRFLRANFRVFSLLAAAAAAAASSAAAAVGINWELLMLTVAFIPILLSIYLIVFIA